jgi:hypothetical protein
MSAVVLAGLVSILAGTQIPLDMSTGWQRRDWQKCQDPTRVGLEGGAISFVGQSAKVQMWQTPLRTGPAPLPAGVEWIRDCDKAPLSYARSRAREIARDPAAIRLSEYPWITWRWRVGAATDDTGLADKKGRIVGPNDFAAKLGLLFLDERSGDMQEIAYVWTRQVPEETLLHQETVVIPMLLKFKLYRIVSESGDKNLGHWTAEARDVLSDYRRIHPKGRPGALVRVYLMADSNNTGSPVDTAFADIVFHRDRPVTALPTKTALGLH